MKILFVIPEYPPDFGGGIVRYYSDLTIALRELGCEVSILKGSGFVHGNQSYRHDGIDVSVLETPRFDSWSKQFQHFTVFPELRQHLAAAFALHEQAKAGEGFDAIEVTDWGFLFLPWVLEAAAPVLVQMHGSCGQIRSREPVAGREAEGLFWSLLEHAGLQSASVLSACSHANAQEWRSRLGREVYYVLPPLKQTISAPQSPLKPTGKPWLAVGRIQHWKGPQVACAAWQKLGQNAPLLEWVGRDTQHGASGNSTDAWLQTKFPKVWRKKIQPVGQLPPPDVFGRMVAAKAVLIPSLWDAFNLVTAEAMALCKAVVVSDGAGAVDLVEHGVNGFVFPQGDSNALAEIVQQVEQLNASDLQRIGKQASESALQCMNPPLIAEQKMQLYRGIHQLKPSNLQWLREMLFRPSERPFLFLDGLPLRNIAKYVFERGVRWVTQGD